ncbi:MAG: serine hydrolase domain-containing protein [Cyclobacteriaceae bacterium]
MRILTKTLLLFLLVFACQPKAEQTDAKYEDAIFKARAIMAEVMEENETPGMAVAVSVKGELVWSEGFGFSDVENQKKVDPAVTLFRIGSVSKTLTASAIALLIEEGKLDVDQPVQTYVPGFPEKKYPITVKQTGGHIAGIRHYRGREMWSDVYYPTVNEGLEIFKDDSLLFEPGTDYSYSSYGWNLISAVIEGASGEEFLTYMQRRVFNPLEMKNTKADIASDEMENRTKFYVRSDTGVVVAPYVDNSYKWAGGGFIASAEDLIIFGHSHVRSGFLKQESLDAVQKPQTLNNGESTNYGMGWRSGEDDEKFYVGHSGGSVGGITQFKIYPEEEVIVALVSNCSPISYKGAESRIARLFMESSN